MATPNGQNIKVSINKNTVIQSLMFFGQFFIYFNTVFYYIEKSAKSRVPFFDNFLPFYKEIIYNDRHI